MTTYIWSIKNMKVIPDYMGYQNVVKYVQWMLTIDNNGSQKTLMGTCSLEDPSDSFVNYDSLTEEDVINWVRSTLGNERVSRMETALANSMLVPTSEITPLPLPWSS